MKYTQVNSKVGILARRRLEFEEARPTAKQPNWNSWAMETASNAMAVRRRQKPTSGFSWVYTQVNSKVGILARRRLEFEEARPTAKQPNWNSWAMETASNAMAVRRRQKPTSGFSWVYLCFILLTLWCCSCQKKEEKKDDFATLTGKDLPTWQYIQTKEDWHHFTLFEKMYEARKDLQKTPGDLHIPKVAHFIWIGPRPFPRKSVENIRSWVAKNPDWTFCFWTDRPRPLPIPGMQLRMIQDLNFLKLSSCFDKSNNYGEKSDILRYEILYQEGGVYIDHDVKCFKSFDVLNRSYDFYCGIDMPYTSSLPSCILTTNNLIGVKSGHPILLRCMELVAEEWDKIESEYPGEAHDEVLNRVLHRTFRLFGEAVKQKNNSPGYRDIVMPAYYFDAPKDELALFARHLYEGSWHETESTFQKMVRQRLMTLTKKSNRTMLIISALSALNLLGLIAIYFSLRKKINNAPPTA